MYIPPYRKTGLDDYTLFLFRYSTSKQRAIFSIPMQRGEGSLRGHLTNPINIVDMRYRS